MPATNPQYDVIFTTDIATIGLSFAGAKLVQLAYLKKTADKAAKNKHQESVKNKIIKYLEINSKLKKLDVDVLLNVTDFQRRVLDQLLLIPYGETRTYSEIAKILKTSPRPVGNACRNNPVPLIIPCHRVVAVNGIGGYDGAKSGNLLNIKYELLVKEGVIVSA